MISNLLTLIDYFFPKSLNHRYSMFTISRKVFIVYILSLYLYNVTKSQITKTLRHKVHNSNHKSQKAQITKVTSHKNHKSQMSQSHRKSQRSQQVTKSQKTHTFIHLCLVTQGFPWLKNRFGW